jgi:hypothetical protein
MGTTLSFGQRHTQMTAWLDENCGSDGWAMTRSGLRGVLNDGVSIYFLCQTTSGTDPLATRRTDPLGWSSTASTGPAVPTKIEVP